jgi:hypothetical protein
MQTIAVGQAPCWRLAVIQSQFTDRPQKRFGAIARLGILLCYFDYHFRIDDG